MAGRLKWCKDGMAGLTKEKTKMIKVTLSESDAQHLEAVRALCAKETETNPSFNGAEFDVSVDDFTAVEDSDEYRGAALLADIHGIVESR